VSHEATPLPAKKAPAKRHGSEFAGTVLWQLPGVRETRSYAVMEEVKNSVALAWL
jgi:Lrp/AsnC family leucine-responsive transcriptional regulator